ncbi:DUF4367 domain-containing protein [Cohnella lupini]|uniref:Uncharacterized protein DUF4367 n=1 Tax=Cohnella lupini TaxID=1294267 RepID=A0A3D9ITD1_9BACL|nr:DUF4367 domain-containing protein [Cohnella lupini]RED65012.1 uncharacterized protein DUF4367 [Cohnella lupini]
MINAQFDRLFDSAFEASEALDHIAVDHVSSWHKVQKRLNTRGKRKKLRSTLTKLAVVAASLMIGAAIFGNTRAVKAIDPLYSTLKEYPSGLMAFFFGRDSDSDPTKALGEPPPAYAEGLNVEKINETTYKVTANLQQSERLLSFRAPSFGFIPDRYSFYRAELFFRDGKDKADNVAFTFINEKERLMTISMEKLAPNTSLGSVTQTGGATSEKIDLAGVPGILYLSGTGSFLEVVKNGIYTNMGGDVPSDQLIKMYEEFYSGK